MKPIKVFIPGIFLFALGIGNLTVGLLKQQQYENVIQELASDQPALELDSASPIQKIQLAKQITGRNYQQLHMANSRLEFYQLVSLGGKIMLCVSILVLLIAVALKIKARDTNTEIA